MTDFQDDVFELEQLAEVAQVTLRSLQEKYFSGIPTISQVEIAEDPTSVACYIPETRTIRINRCVARFPRLVQFLILHELVHHKLTIQNPGYVFDPYGEAFVAETEALYQQGAYKGLL